MSSTIPIDPVNENPMKVPKIVIDSFSTVDDLNVTPASSSFPTNDDAPAQAGEPNGIELDLMAPAPASPPILLENNPRPSQHSLQMLDELKYLLKPTNSLASPVESVQASVRLIFRSIFRLLVPHDSKKRMQLVNVDRLKFISISPTTPNVS
jgi:hypothetical protein